MLVYHKDRHGLREELSLRNSLNIYESDAWGIGGNFFPLEQLSISFSQNIYQPIPTPSVKELDYIIHHNRTQLFSAFDLLHTILLWNYPCHLLPLSLHYGYHFMSENSRMHKQSSGDKVN